MRIRGGVTATLEASEPPSRSDVASSASTERSGRSGTTEQFAVAEETETGPTVSGRGSKSPATTADLMAGGIESRSRPPQTSATADVADAEAKSFGAALSTPEPVGSPNGTLPPPFDREKILGKHGSQIPVIPCCCGTCIDFRPTEGGKSGMCMNRMAFAQPSMVSADDIACASSIGNWWVPNNDWWEQKLDTSSHTQPTPNFDALIKHLLEQFPKAKREAR